MSVVFQEFIRESKCFSMQTPLWYLLSVNNVLVCVSMFKGFEFIRKLMTKTKSWQNSNRVCTEYIFRLHFILPCLSKIPTNHPWHVEVHIDTYTVWDYFHCNYSVHWGWAQHLHDFHFRYLSNMEVYWETASIMHLHWDSEAEKASALCHHNAGQNWTIFYCCGWLGCHMRHLT